ncbi:PBSX family phage terminase large subunit [Paenibacillus thiaminolyticus]|uniref:PBSX family phage terminase large subunit n=1 Tax=Paenibacillus thiaminolyticus TaxID=49283 RepID=UPI0025432696|nr:PBSX family phage terminase large subunit [Paenibacillus thiaminolyticus]WII36831.1 PBSX family phage terminase large subunit [Paenibacillus thiaminolyticus]
MARLKLKPPPFKWKPFSEKQVRVLTWWMPESLHHNKDGIICDGSVRAGKTVAMSLSYVFWAMESFNGEQFGMAGKTIGALRRNVIGPLKRMLTSRGYSVHDNLTDNVLTISRGLVANYFFLFGGKDERSQDLIQGITLAGMFFDEVALMPQSFVNQAVARCSVEGRKYWFNCNPAGPYHWFKLEWLDQAVEKHVLHLHFTMDDNLSLSEQIKEGYRRLFSGVFYKRYILGLWVLAEGVIYDMFDKDKHVVQTTNRFYTQYYVSCDYGTKNPTTFGLWGLYDRVWYKVKEYHYDGRKNGVQKTDEQYCNDLEDFVGDVRVNAVIIDPSAASFIAAIRKRGKFSVMEAENTVVDGIRNVAAALGKGTIKYNDCCVETFREFSSYVWDEKAAQRGEDKPVKQYDHQLDADRYFVNTILFGFDVDPVGASLLRGGKIYG